MPKKHWYELDPISFMPGKEYDPENMKVHVDRSDVNDMIETVWIFFFSQAHKRMMGYKINRHVNTALNFDSASRDLDLFIPLHKWNETWIEHLFIEDLRSVSSTPCMMDLHWDLQGKYELADKDCTIVWKWDNVVYCIFRDKHGRIHILLRF